MSTIDKNVHRPWLAYALEESLDQSLLTPKDVINHANPEVLVTQLPPPVISVLLTRALAIGTFSAAQVLESAPPALLAEHLDPEVMWRCLKDAAERGGISRAGDARSRNSRQWFASVLGRALESGLVTPADVLRFLPPTEFVAATPRPVMAELLEEALAHSKFDAELVLQHITPTVIAEDLETSLVWECLVEAAERHFEMGTTAVKTSGPSPAKTVAAPTPAPIATAPVTTPTTTTGAAPPTTTTAATTTTTTATTAAPTTMTTTPSSAPMTPTPAPTAAAARPAAVASGKPTTKSPEKDRSGVERQAPSANDDKTPSPAFIGPSSVAAKSPNGGPATPRGEVASSRVPAAVPFPVPAAPTARHDNDDWTPFRR